MKRMKRVAWFLFAGCCCAAGLMLMAGERLPKSGAEAVEETKKPGGEASQAFIYCPLGVYGQYNGVWYYWTYQQGQSCDQNYIVSSSFYYPPDACGVCSDPIYTTGHPAPIADDKTEPKVELMPQADPLFSGVLR